MLGRHIHIYIYIYIYIYMINMAREERRAHVEMECKGADN
jgi:hypothetical protein